MFRQNTMFGNQNYPKYTPMYSQPTQNVLNPNQNIQPEVINTQPIKQTPVQENIVITPQEPAIKFLDKNEIFDFINTKFSKLDEALLSFKHERYPIKLEDEIEEKTVRKEKVRETNDTIEKNIIKKQKKAYGNIDDNLFLQVKEKYPNFPEDKKDIVVIDNDGNFFINKNKKKIPLNNVNTLKLINKK
jgi:hypothetical protein